MSIKNWPATERPREKLLSQGAASLTDAELLAIFLRTGVAGKSAVDLARQLLSEFGSLRALLEADLKTFSSHLGLGVAKYTQLQAIIEMGKRHLAEKLQKGTVMDNPQVVRDFLCTQLRGEPHEVFGCLFLDSKYRVIAYENQFYGSINESTVYPRQIIKRGLHFNAAAIIFTHNHPSGIAEPSNNDKVLTKELIKALSYVDIKVLDHLIIGEGEPFSMAEWGMI
ncbi:RadC family protein [Entomomonas asaccharolytica]|uniref:DNA repair protein RadC n=1 Tax=Entomomonas asaccharolytica TaxID=2785331 RepID=A0A974NG73_9GAMM|nr:DNA repair protein RadC [Entomomonas asaccharolytica]QQP85979.1 DNA repair protein RadC [Entomomonas asaccharolytica]